jgi:sugar (pentulose or hexulose) kinase
MVLFGADGKLVKRIIGWDEARGKELRQAIDAQLAKAPASKSTNQAKPASPKAKKS